MTAKDILVKYWGHTEFRSDQEKVIKSVLSGEDTLALLPIGSGKSICFQIPTLMRKGLCLVVSPLISLMIDQTKHLESKGVKSIFISSAINRNQIDMKLTNCIYGNIKFLYLSPEMLNNKLIIEKLKKIDINLIAIDEAHCISDWGHNFRPAYRKIVNLKDSIPNIPILALTATATKEIVADIQQNLKLDQKNIIRSSFKKENISYVVIHTDNKLLALLKLLNKIRSSVIIYANSRKSCKSITSYLIKQKMSVSPYHGGMNQKERNDIQEEWIRNNTRIIVATNAFGMGINKTDIRLIIHFDLPFSIEAYTQESGRAGRDGELAYSFLLYSKSDSNQLKEKIQQRFPSSIQIKEVYQKLMNYLQIPEYALPKNLIDFDIYNFCERYRIKILTTYNIFKYLEQKEILKLSHPKYSPSKIKFTINSNELYRFQIENKQYDQFIKLLLRSYPGVFMDFINIQEEYLSKNLQVSQNKIKDLLMRLEKLEILNYFPENNNSIITFFKHRLDVENLVISQEEIDERKNLDLLKFRFMDKYIKNIDSCRRNLLLSHFGELEEEKCGICDSCVQQIKKKENQYDRIKNQILELLKEKELSFEEMSNRLKISDENLKKILDYMFNSDLIEKLGNKYIHVKKIIN